MKTKLIAFVAALTLTATSAVAQTKAATELQNYKTAQAMAEANLRTFDTLDFDVFSNQEWERLAESHAKDIKVYWPDGHVAQGLDRHIDDLKYMFTYAPDTRIKVHPVKVGQGEWTAVMGVMEGTFTQPMTLPSGKVIQPNGKTFKLPMATIGHWNKDGVMSEEYLFWDNQSYMTQLGLAD
jgi:Icc-related predicted phosphoesterase